jgi:type II secretory pathway pseudopilin PulG
MVPRVLRFRLRSLLVLIALLGLLLTVILQTVRLERAASREARLQEELRAAIDQMYTLFAERAARQATSDRKSRREFLERSSKFYKAMEANASSPEVMTRALKQLKQLTP